MMKKTRRVSVGEKAWSCRAEYSGDDGRVIG